MGGSVGKNESSNSSDYDQGVWDVQGDALKDLYDSASGLFSGSNFDQFQDMAGNLQPYMDNIMGGGMGGYNNMLGGGSIGDTSDIRSALMESLQSTQGGSNLGNMYNSIVGGEGNTYIDPMVDAMKDSSMENLDRMQSGTAMDAASMGQGGSSRHAMQNAMQARDVNNDMLDRETTMRGGAYDTDLQMKMDIARQADQGIQNTQSNYMNMLGMADNNANSGMGYGSNLMNLGMGSMNPMMQAFNMPWNALGQYSNVIGNPTVLGSGSGSGSSKGGSTSTSLKG